MATIYARKTKAGKRRYQAIIRLKGFPTIRQTFPNKTLAREWSRKVEAEMLSGRFLPRLGAEMHTLSEAIDRYLETNLVALSEHERRVRVSQLRWWRKRLGDLSLASVTPAVISDTRAEDLKGLAGSTTNRYLSALSAVLDRAEKEWEWIERNPVPKVRRAKDSPGRVRYLSDEERKRLLRACREDLDPRLYPLVLFAITTGARRGELLGLRWEDIDLANLRAGLKKTKNRDRRSISFPGAAGDVLRQMARTPHISGYLFANPQGKPTFPAKPWHRAVEAAEIEDFRFHDLRHTAASYLAMSGATLPELAAFLGHRTLIMVQRYSHLSEGHSESVARRMAERFLAE